MPNPATTALPTGQDERIPGLPVLPANTERATLSIPVYNPATNKTHQAPLVAGDGDTISNAVVGGPKFVRYRDSRLYGVPAKVLTLDRLKPATIVPGTLAYVENPSDTPLSTTDRPKNYVATLVSPGTAGAINVPRYIGAAATDTVPITWQEAIPLETNLAIAYTREFVLDELANNPLFSLVPGARYDLSSDWNGSGDPDQVVSVEAATATAFEGYGELLKDGVRSFVEVDVRAGTATPAQSQVDLSQYPTRQELEDFLAGKADLVGSYVKDGQIPLATSFRPGLMQIGRGLTDEGNGLVSNNSINWRVRLVAGAGNSITPRHSDYFHVQNDVYVSTAFLGIGDQFVIRQSEFTYSDRYAVVYIDGVPAHPIRPGGLIQFRRQPNGTLDVVFQSNSQPVYSNGLVPNAVQAAVIASTFDANNTMTSTVPDGSGASMQFYDAAYVYQCFQIDQGVSGLRVVNWVRLPKVAGAGNGVTYTAGDGIAISPDGKISATGGGGGGGTSFAGEDAQDAMAALLAAGTGNVKPEYDDASNKLSLNVELPEQFNIYGYSSEKRDQVFNTLFTSTSQRTALDLALNGDTSTGEGSRIPDLVNGVMYELVSDKDKPRIGASGLVEGTLTWIRYRFA